MKKFKNLIAVILLTFAVGCSVIYINKSNDIHINQQLDERLDAEVDLLNNKKDTIKK